MELIQEALLSLLSAVVIGAIGLLTTYATSYFKQAIAKAKAQAEKLSDENQKQLVNDALDRTSTIVEKTIVAANETLVKEVTAATEDNKITKEDGERILASVKSDVLSQLSDDAKELLSTEIGDLELYIEKEVETTLAKLKGKY